MKIVVDESVSFGVVSLLRNKGYAVISVAERSSGLKDVDVFKLVKKNKAIFITRDSHFTNSLRFPPKDTECIIFIRKGNLKSQEEINLIEWLFNNYPLSNFKGSLVTVSRNNIRVR